MVPFPVDLHQVPGVAAGGIAGDIFAGDAGDLHQQLIGLGVAGAHRGVVHQGTLGGVGGLRHVAAVQAHIVRAVEHQVVVEGLGDVVAAHTVGDHLSHHSLGLGPDLFRDDLPAGDRRFLQFLGPVEDDQDLVAGDDIADAEGIFPVDVGDLTGQRLHLGGAQMVRLYVQAVVVLQKAVEDGSPGPFFVRQANGYTLGDLLFFGLLGLFGLLLLLGLPAGVLSVSQLLEQAVDYVGPGAGALGGEAQPGSEAAGFGAAYGGV